MKKFKIKTKFVFTGHFEVMAENRQEAKGLIDRYCGLVLGGNIHTGLPDYILLNWKFDVHPQKIVS